ncbi:hypothetical protein [Candidatus Methylomicrobium oryzae]|uniref:hypothetical protein n=1 Tax=Candidatus Methylomicrobium oryzae TaxID=2802053 RepID=UPI001921932D|nr:hypothetical protein [Methylomicrobium sp. RS1]MBL1265488.1 hypothetical protein [Methylomicrobium sp. RS1]
MMLDEARIARERLMCAEAAKLNVVEARELANKKYELRELVKVVKSLAERREWLQQGGVPLSRAPDVDKAKQLCDKILVRFIESPKNDTLVRNRGWINLLDALKAFKIEEETQQKQDWKEYFACKLFGGVPPEQRKQTLTLSLPVNKSAFERYEHMYRLVSQYKSAVPNSKEQLINVQTWSEQLAEINSEFVENDDVPVAVRAFFSATATTHGASLELLTEEVITWLRANNMLNNYAVRAR